MATRRFLSGLPKGVYKGGRTRYALRKQVRKTTRKVQRYFGFGRYDARNRSMNLTAKMASLDMAGSTKHGHKITGLSPKYRKAQKIAVGLRKKQRRRVLTAVGGIYGGLLGASMYSAKKKTGSVWGIPSRRKKR